MRRPFYWATLFTLFAIVYYSCTTPVEETRETITTKPVMREVSELVQLMFKMEGDLKLIRSSLTEDSTFNKIESFTYDDLFTAEASKDVDRDSIFVVNGSAYLKGVLQLSECSDQETAISSFNNVVDACVTCHLGYCPGPVARIKKLRIN